MIKLDKIITTSRYFIKIISHPIFVWCFVLVALLVIHLSYKVGVQEPLFVIVALTAGWIVAFHTTYWSQKKNFINDLKFKAAKSIIKISADASNSLIVLQSDISLLKTQFNLRKDSNGDLYSDWEDIRSKISRHYDNYTNHHISMLGIYEENEILFMNLRKLIDIFCIRHGKISGAHYKFSSTLHVLMLAHEKVPREDKYTEKIRAEADEFSNLCWETIGYLGDLRKELLNKTLGAIVHAKVPNRKPQDPDIKILSEIAKEEKIIEQ